MNARCDKCPNGCKTLDFRPLELIKSFKSIEDEVADCLGRTQDLGQENLTRLVSNISESLESVLEMASGYMHEPEFEDVRPKLEIMSHQRLSLYLLGFHKDQSTGIHDHGQSAGVFKVLEGNLTEDVYTPKQEALRAKFFEITKNTHQRLSIMKPCFMEGNYIHNLFNQQDELVVSLHAYTPELTEMAGFTEDGNNLQTLEEPTWKKSA